MHAGFETTQNIIVKALPEEPFLFYIIAPGAIIIEKE
jgi:hypothetical protein